MEIQQTYEMRLILILIPAPIAKTLWKTHTNKDNKNGDEQQIIKDRIIRIHKEII